MKTSPKRSLRRGYISYIMVLSTGIVLTLLTFFVYRRAVTARDVQTKIHMRIDYSEKEDAVLRSLVAIVPNRAMSTMMDGSNGAPEVTNPLRWRDIFSEALDMANARTSISEDMIDQLAVPNLIMSNLGDSSITNTHEVFHPLGEINANEDNTFVTSGLNASAGTDFPVPLQTANATTTARDAIYPIISNDKVYGALAEGQLGLSAATYPNFNLIPYPQINFGYAEPGQLFVAKRNWWAFEMSLAGADWAMTKLSAPRRSFVLSIYEIPSQLAISSSAFLSLGKHASGDEWNDATIEGRIFAGKAVVEGSTEIEQLSSRRSMTLADTARIGGETFHNNPFLPGTREEYQLTTGQFFPVSLASESGRVAFVPINRGAEFYDLYAHEERDPSYNSNSLSITNWNQYSIGALQCAMQLSLKKVDADGMPEMFEFTYMKSGVRTTLPVDLSNGVDAGLPTGYIVACNEGQSYDFGDSVVDVAYGGNGQFVYQYGVTGVVTFNNERFGDPNGGSQETGYFRPSYPFSDRKGELVADGRPAIVLEPEKFKEFLRSLNADGPEINHSIVINVDYTTSGLNNTNYNPMENGRYRDELPGRDWNYALKIMGCRDFTEFPKGFSIVSNMRAYIGDDFNTTEATPPAGYPVTDPPTKYYPPVSLFVPEKRFGVDEDPYAITISGQVGSLASETGIDGNAIRPLDSTSVTERVIDVDQIKVNLRPIVHPASMPPISMMNWLIVVEEIR